MIFAKVVKYGNGYAIELVNNIGQHIDYFTKSNGTTKVWRYKEQAEKVMESNHCWYKA